MYVGRFVVVWPGGGAYRVSSRSFPNRQIVDIGDALQVSPTADATETDNPYVSYTCLRHEDDRVTFGNGSHVDPIADKLALGYPPRDALASGLLTMDFERDDYDTPRIGAIAGGETAHIGIVRRDALIVNAVTDPTLVATYECDEPEPISMDWTTADEAARCAYELDYEHPVCAAGVTVDQDEVDTAVYNGPGTT